MTLSITRRNVVKALASVTAAVELKTLAAGQTMYLALNSVLISNRVPWPEFARLAAKVGFPGTDVMLDSAMKAGAEATKDLLAELKLKSAVLNFPVEFRKDDAAFDASLSKLGETAEFASKIGCPRMMTYIMPSSNVPKEQLVPIYKKRFTSSARVLAQSGLRLALEFLGPLHLRKAQPYEFIWRMNDMLAFTKECGPNVGLLLDSWHWHHAGATTQDIINAGRERIVHVHFNDAPDLPPEQIRDNERLLPGEGVINLVGFLQALKKIGYRDALSVEVFGRLKNAPVEEAAKMALEASNGVFKKAGIATG